MGLNTKPTEPLNCPRCESTKTKFCYYNNYNKSQPRHFCKGCKRHWTQGGVLRNVPIGGRKNKRPLKITSTSRDDIGAGQGECKASSTLCHEIFNPPCPAPTISGSTREKSNSQMVVVQSKQNYDQNFPLVTSNIDEEKNIFDNFPSSSLPYDIIDTMFKGSIGTIPCSNIYNYMGNLDCALEDYSTITWQGPTRTSSVMDIEALVAADEFNIAWDDTEIKP